MTTRGTYTFKQAQGLAWHNGWNPDHGLKIEGRHDKAVTVLPCLFQDPTDPATIIGLKGDNTRNSVDLEVVRMKLADAKNLNSLKDYQFTLNFSTVDKAKFYITRGGNPFNSHNGGVLVWPEMDRISTKLRSSPGTNAGKWRGDDKYSFKVTDNYNLEAWYDDRNGFEISKGNQVRILPFQKITAAHFGKKGFNKTLNLEDIIDGDGDPPTDEFDFQDSVPYHAVPWDADAHRGETAVVLKFDDEWALNAGGGKKVLFPGAHMAFPIYAEMAFGMRGLKSNRRVKAKKQVLDYNVIYFFEDQADSEEPITAATYTKFLKTLQAGSTTASTNKNKTIPGGYVLDKLCEFDDQFFKGHPINNLPETTGNGTETTCKQRLKAAESEVETMCLSDSMKNIENKTCTIKTLENVGEGWGSLIQAWVDGHCADIDNQVGHGQCAMYALQNVQEAVEHCRESNVTSSTCTTLVTEFDEIEKEYEKALNPCKGLKGKKKKKCKRNTTTELEMSGDKGAWVALKAQVNLYNTLSSDTNFKPADFELPSFSVCSITAKVEGDMSGGEIKAGCVTETNINKASPPGAADGDEDASVSGTDSLGVNTSATGNGEGSSNVTVNKDGEEVSSAASTPGGTTSTATGEEGMGTMSMAISSCLFLMFIGMVCAVIGGIVLTMHRR